MEYIHDYLKKLLKKNNNYIGEDGDLLISKIVEDARLYNSELIKFLINDKRCKDYFFEKIDDVTIFKSEDFRMCINDARFLGNSFTKYGNKIGLITDRTTEKIMNEDYVVLSYPYKDCTLDGGMTKTEAKRTNRKETMINNILFKEDIHKLKNPKAFKNFKKYSFENGKVKEETPTTIKANENIIINGNNFAALCSLKAKFAGKIKLIYIDPPYNTGSDTFSYNDNFNHSTWLVFMKDRLQLAKELLRDDGAIFVQCDDNEQAYLKVLMDEIFGRDNFINTISVKMTPSSGVKRRFANIKFIKNKEFILIYKKSAIFIKPIYDEIYNYDPHYSIYFDGEEFTTIDEKMKKLNIDCKNIKKEFYLIEPNIKKFIKEHKDYIYADHPPSKWAYKQIENATPIFQIKDDKKSRSIVYKIYNPNNKNEYELIFNSLTGFRRLEPITWKMNENLELTSLRGDFWDNNYDKDIGNINKEGYTQFGQGQKPERLLMDIINSITEKNDIVLDFFAGSGTALAVAHKMNRRYIGVEQIQEHFDICVERLKKVIEGDSSGISKNVNWQGGGEFITFDIASYNADWAEKIKKIKDDKEFKKIFEDMEDKSLINHRLQIDYPKKEESFENDEEFLSLDLKRKKEILLELLDKNMFYVPFSEIKDKTFKLSDDDIELSDDFYS